MRTVVVYPGRFQPFGKHHFQTYKWLTEKFGTENVYVTTSNVVNSNSPLTFDEKYSIMTKFGVPKDKIVEAEKPYMPSSLLDTMDSGRDSMIVAYGQKDYGRIGFTKKDGSPSYFVNYTGQKELAPFKENAFVVVAPHVSIKHKGYEICGSYLRELLSTCTRKEMFEVMGWTDEGIYSTFRRKFTTQPNTRTVEEVKSVDRLYEVSQFKEVLTATTGNQGKYSKHINHPYEADITFGEFKRLVFDLTKNPQEIKNCTLKLDGWNFQMTYKNGRFRCSRNKGTVVNPMSFDELTAKYAENPKTQAIFCKAFKVIESALSGNKIEDLQNAFDNGAMFLNFEILEADPLNVINTGYRALSVHGMVSYDVNGNELHRSVVLPQIVDVILGRVFNQCMIIETPKITLKSLKSPNYFVDRLSLMQHKFRIPEATKIQQLPKEIHSELKILILELGNALIKSSYNKADSNMSVNRIVSIIDAVVSGAKPQDTAVLEDSFYLLDKLGGLPAINPIEGFVFDWGDNTYKLTGTFGALVPVFRIWNKMRFS